MNKDKQTQNLNNSFLLWKLSANTLLTACTLKTYGFIYSDSWGWPLTGSGLLQERFIFHWSCVQAWVGTDPINGIQQSQVESHWLHSNPIALQLTRQEKCLGLWLMLVCSDQYHRSAVIYGHLTLKCKGWKHRRDVATRYEAMSLIYLKTRGSWGLGCP